MAWTDPTTRSTGDLVTAAIWNTDIVDNLENLHNNGTAAFIVRGVVNTDGSVFQGSGFTSAKTDTGKYTIVFSEPFATYPIFVATTYQNVNARQVNAVSVATGTVTVAVYDGEGAGVGDPVDNPFLFIAVAS